jgi:hypothetical protein
MHAYYPPCALVVDELVPINRPTAVLTPRGHAALSVIRLGYELAELDGPDRAYIVGMLRDLIEGAGA